MTVALVLVGCVLVMFTAAAVIAWLLNRKPEPPEFAELRRAVAELESAIGDALEPVLVRLADRLDRWSRRA